jgi:lipopolysaccharide transport system ATP-binding protein
MPAPALNIENISKKYRIGIQRHDTLRDQLGDYAGRLTAGLKRSAKSDAEKGGSDHIWALREVSFAVEQGEVIGVIGRNGAGKSTLLKILSHITAPTTGKVEIWGRIGSLLEVGTGFHQELTGRENIYMNGAILGMTRKEIERKFDEIIDFSGIEKFLDTPVKRYSSGMYVRLAFAVAAHLEPEILLVDEVLAVGDVAFQRKCLGKMSDIARQGRTVLFVSHNMAAIQTLCTRGIYLDAGQVILDDNIEKVTGFYLNSLEQSVTVPIREREDRTGRGNVRLLDVNVTSISSESADRTGLATLESQTLATGRPARFEFIVTEARPGLICTLTILDQNAIPVCFFRSSMIGPEDELDSRLGNKLICQIDELLLLPGQYRMRVELDLNNHKEDYLEAAGFFNVEQGQLHKRITYENNQYGSITMPHSWRLPYQSG